MSPCIVVFIALNCEAKPLIRKWCLKKQPGKHPFAIYADEQRMVVVTGIGKVAMAGAVAYTLASFQGMQQPILLNLGIAGHRSYPLASLCLADKIVDVDTGKTYYPQLPFFVPCPSLTVATQARPCVDYAEDYLYDMEAAAFYEMAVKFSTSELIHCLKIVSDNSRAPLENISEALVEDWCDQQLTSVERMIASLERLRQILPTITSELYEQLIGQFHFTATSSTRLKALLNRWQLLMPGEIPDWKGVNPRSGKDLIVWMEKRLETAVFYL